MKIAILSGKGGTGKTLVSVNLASVANNSFYLDCDVEEPNGHLFFKPKNNTTETVSVKNPQVNEDLCNGCRKCVEFCKFNALAYIADHLMVFEDICHSCGGCSIICPEKAITEKDKAIGIIKQGISENVTVISGILNTGEISGVPIIKEMINKERDKKETVFIDCPPGSACVVMESIKDADYCVIVAEPTLFGVHNLNMVYELVKIFKKPFGVILNKSLEGQNPAKQFCLDHSIRIIGDIPFNHQIGLINSNGGILARESLEYRSMFNHFLEIINKEVPH